MLPSLLREPQATLGLNPVMKLILTLPIRIFPVQMPAEGIAEDVPPNAIEGLLISNDVFEVITMP